MLPLINLGLWLGGTLAGGRIPGCPPLYGIQEGVGKGGEESKMQDGDKSDAKEDRVGGNEGVSE